VEYSRIYDNGKCGIQFYDKTGGVDHNTFRYNEVYNNGYGLQGGQYSTTCTTGVWIGAGTGTLAYNNLIWKNKGHGIMIGGGAANAQIYHNDVSGHGAYGLFIKNGALNAVVRNNIVHGNGQEGIYKGAPSAILTNNLTSDPGGGDAQ
jgi:parallel beta helix pectate lyase-like protein